jgi:1-pyrroline-5-carboxylate dehydrogenase
MATAEISTQIPLRGPAGEFRNEPFLDFSRDDVARAMRNALAQVADQLGQEYDLVIGGKRYRTDEKIRSLNPSRPAEVIAVHQKAGAGHADMAVHAALDAFDKWRFTTAEERASLIFKAAALLRERRIEFAAWLSYEVGKNWTEADVEVAEAIDFLEFYARQALRLAQSAPTLQYPGERNELHYIPLGVGAVIPPWNFALAIMAGMTVAAVVSGNTVVLKPSSDSPTVAARFFNLLEEAGMPAGVVNFCPGSGPVFGNALVEHPKTRFIAFTGSKDVGLDIHLRAAQTRPGQIWIKRTIMEMGGKDSIIVDADCDLDAAVEGVVSSAFGYTGQKCSACSRAIVDDKIHDIFVDRLRERIRKLTVADATENPSMGPVINKTARESILRYIEIGKQEGRLVIGGEAVQAPDGGFFIAPTAFSEIDPRARLSQEEIFGPVLAIIRSHGFDEALEIANNTEYGLTGSIYSTDRDKLDRARNEFHVGNLYFNRKSTGALVGVHPFGGFNMSGTDSKAGGADYLYLFTQAKSVSEKLK